MEEVQDDDDDTDFLDDTDVVEGDLAAQAGHDILRQVASRLAEHYDTVQIFCTRHEPTEAGTVAVSFGYGNSYARLGQVREWCGNMKAPTKTIITDYE
jgi:hypothetical protein